jgi:hypothetical protein
VPKAHRGPTESTAKELYATSDRRCGFLCVKHATEVDLRELESTYTAAVLRQWKANQLAAYDAEAGGWVLSDDEAADVVEASVHSEIVIRAHTVSLGGGGGNAIGASGGGGGAIGPGAIGGPGGDVGQIDLRGSDGIPPGSGGGGGGSMAWGTIFPAPSGRSRGTEGQGFSAGMDGQDGGASSFGVGDEVLLTAPGGTGGRSGTGVRLTSDKLSVSALILANYAEATAGLIYVIGGGWQNYQILNIPCPFVFPLLIIFEAGGVEVGEYTIGVEARDPGGIRHGLVQFPLTVAETGDVVRIPRCCTLATEVDALGIWTVAVTTPLGDLATVDLLIKRPGS